MTQAYPLAWPDGWPRTPAHKRDGGSKFYVGHWNSGGRNMPSFDKTRRQLLEELHRLKAKNVVLSTDVPLRNDGNPYAGAVSRKMDPGVAVYFTLNGKPTSMAQDAFTTIEANLRSLTLAIDAMRSLERHGGGVMMERAFTGFASLPPPEGSRPARPWREVLGMVGITFPDTDHGRTLQRGAIQSAYRELAKNAHADAGGTDAAMLELNQARDQALAETEGRA